MSHRSTWQPSATPARRRVLALLGLGLAGALGACGKRGPLRLPEAAPAPPPDANATAEEAE